MAEDKKSYKKHATDNDDKKDITILLQEFPSGDKDLIDKLFLIVYEDLKALAHTSLRNEKHPRSLNTTDVVHEAYGRLVKGDVKYQNRSHFFTLAGRAMRRILVDEARRRNAQKRGCGQLPVSIEQLGDIEQKENPWGRSFEIIESIHNALIELEKYSKRLCIIVEFRFFLGLNTIETAEILGLSRTTVSNDWKWARLLLASLMKKGSSHVSR